MTDTNWSIKPALPNYEFDWTAHNPVTREEVEKFFHSDAHMHTAPLNQVDEAGVKDFLAIRKPPRAARARRPGALQHRHIPRL